MEEISLSQWLLRSQPRPLFGDGRLCTAVVTAKMLTMRDMRLWTGEADMQVPPFAHYLLLTLGTLGYGQAINRQEFEACIAALATVEGRVWQFGVTLVPVLTIHHNLTAQFTSEER